MFSSLERGSCFEDSSLEEARGWNTKHCSKVHKIVTILL